MAIATPKRWLSKGAMINQYMGIAPSTFQVISYAERKVTQSNPRSKLKRNHLKKMDCGGPSTSSQGVWKPRLFVSFMTILNSVRNSIYFSRKDPFDLIKNTVFENIKKIKEKKHPRLRNVFVGPF